MPSKLRVLRILHSLRTQWRSVRDLAEEHDVDRKTIRRDLDDIRAAGFTLRVKEEARGKKVYRLK